MNQTDSPFLADSSLLQALEKWSDPIPCEETRVLFHQGDGCSGLFILHSGEATLEMNCCDTGDTVIRFRTPEGSLLGLPAHRSALLALGDRHSGRTRQLHHPIPLS